MKPQVRISPTFRGMLRSSFLATGFGLLRGFSLSVPGLDSLLENFPFVLGRRWSVRCTDGLKATYGTERDYGKC